MIDNNYLVPTDSEILSLEKFRQAKELCREEIGYDPEDNKRNKIVVGVYYIRKNVDPSLKYNSARTGNDLVNERFPDGPGEHKSTELARCKKKKGYRKSSGFSYENTNHSFKEEELYRCKIHLMSAFDKTDGRLIFSIYLNTDKAISQINMLFPEKVKKVREDVRKSQEKGKIGWNAFTISIDELVNIEEIVIIDGNGKRITKEYLYTDILGWDLK